MFLIKIIRGLTAFVTGAIITLVFLAAALICAAGGWPSNWPAKWWGWLEYWLVLRLLAGIRLVHEYHGIPPEANQPVVSFGTHPLDPALPAWTYDVNRQFPGRHFAPTARDDHPLSPGFKAIGGVTFSSQSGREAQKAIKDSLGRMHNKVLLTIFPDVHRWSPGWHKKLWEGTAVTWGHTPHNHTLPWKAGGLQKIYQALPQAAYYRCVVCFSEPAWGWAGFYKASGTRLLIRYDRVYPPADLNRFQSWVSEQAAEAERITGQFMSS